MLPEKLQIPVSFAMSKGLELLVKKVLNVAVDATLKWDATSITLAQIKYKLEQIEKSLDDLLKADFVTAKKRFGDAMIYIEDGHYARAYKELDWVLTKSIDAFSRVKGFDNKVFAKRLTIFARLMIDTYDKDTKTFVPLSSLSTKKKHTIAKLIFSDVDDVVNEFEKGVEDRSIVSKGFASFKNTITLKNSLGSQCDKNQNSLDGLLKSTLPLIWHHFDIFKETSCQDPAFLRYIPNGYNDAVTIQLENKWPIKVWKNYLGGRTIFRMEPEEHHKEFDYDTFSRDTIFKSFLYKPKLPSGNDALFFRLGI